MTMLEPRHLIVECGSLYYHLLCFNIDVYLILHLGILRSSFPKQGCTRGRLECAGEEQRLEGPPHGRSPGGRRRTPGVRFPGVEQPTEEQGRWGTGPS